MIIPLHIEETDDGNWRCIAKQHHVTLDLPSDTVGNDPFIPYVEGIGISKDSAIEKYKCELRKVGYLVKR